jgi:hypothetical protein
MEKPEIQPLDMTAESQGETWLPACPSRGLEGWGV